MTYFQKRTPQFCADEIKTANEYVSQVFQAGINLNTLKELIESLIDNKIEGYYYNRFKDWPVADLLTLVQTIDSELGKPMPESTTERKTRKTKVDKNGQELRNA